MMGRTMKKRGISRVALVSLVFALLIGVTACLDGPEYESLEAAQVADAARNTAEEKAMPKEPDPVGSGKLVEAWVAAMFLMEDNLISPSTAKFHGGGWSPYVKYLANNRYLVTASVNSQNGFGAMVRTYFQAIVRDEKDEHQTWVGVVWD